MSDKIDMKEELRNLKVRMDAGVKIGERVFIANSASVMGDVELCDDSSIWYNTTVRGDLAKIKVGRRSNIQDNCIVHVHIGNKFVEIGDDTTIGHHVCLHGCKIGNNVLIGIGSTLLDDVQIGDNSIVAAGTIIPPGKVIPPFSKVVGTYKNITPLSEQDIAFIKDYSANYVLYKDAYLANGYK